MKIARVLTIQIVVLVAGTSPLFVPELTFPHKSLAIVTCLLIEILLQLEKLCIIIRSHPYQEILVVPNKEQGK